MENFWPKKSTLFWSRTVGSVETSGNSNLTSHPFLFFSGWGIPCHFTTVHAYECTSLGRRIMSNMKLKYTVISGIFPDILIQGILVREILQLLFFARPFRLFQSFGQVLVSAYIV